MDDVLLAIQAAREDFEAACNEVRRALDRDQRFPPTSLVRQRWKDVRRTREKLVNASAAGRPITLENWHEQITDLMGVRYVGLLYPDKYAMSDFIIAAADAGNVEIRQASPPVETLREVSDRGTPIPDDIRVSGYSSFHFVVIPAAESSVHKARRLPVEVQVRTIFEEAFAEISHQYVYERQRSGTAVPENATRLLGVLAEILRPAARMSELIAVLAEPHPGIVNVGEAPRSDGESGTVPDIPLEHGVTRISFQAFVADRLGRQPSVQLLNRASEVLGAYDRHALDSLVPWFAARWEQRIGGFRRFYRGLTGREPFDDTLSFDDDCFCWFAYVVRIEQGSLSATVVEAEISRLARELGLY